MLKIRFILSFTILAIAISSFNFKTEKKENNAKDLEQLLHLLEGKFSSQNQAEKDSDYFNISLVMTQIWKDRTDGKWLYVEQAVAVKPDKPYRQRVYHLQQAGNNTFTSDIYTIKDAALFIGLQNDDSKKAKLTMEMIELKNGCRVTLVKKDNAYEGGTEGSMCPSDLKGASYATTKITLKAGELVSWDQGFDTAGKQVWGAVKGGYIFIKE